MKKFLFIAAAAIAVLSSCSKDIELQEDNYTSDDGTIFTATIEQSLATKTELGSGNAVNWENGDLISINGTEYSASSGYPRTKATFTKVSGETPTPTYYAYYPSDIFNGTKATLPAVQDGFKYSIKRSPMYAMSNSNSLEFKNICGLLAFYLTSDVLHDLKRVRVSSSNHDISGDFTVNGSNEAVLVNDEGGANVFEITNLTSVRGTYYIPLPPGTYREIKIELSYDGDYFNKTMTTKAGTDIVIARNTIYPLTFVDNNYFCLTANGSVTVALNKTTDDTPANGLKYRVNDADWAAYSYGTAINLSSGQKLFFTATEDRTEAFSDSKYLNFSVTGDGTVDVSGDIMHLLNKDCMRVYLEGSGDEYACYGLFKDCTKLIHADQLKLSPMAIRKYFYGSMFQGCTNLETAPYKIAALSTGNYFCCNMFYGCSSLTVAPILPTNIYYGSFFGMFYGCTNLTSITCLATSGLSNVTDDWVTGVNKTGTFTIAASAKDIWEAKAANAGKPTNFTYVCIE